MKKAWMVLVPVGVALMLMGGVLYFFCVAHGAVGWHTRWGDWDVVFGKYGVSIGPVTLYGRNPEDYNVFNGALENQKGPLEANLTGLHLKVGAADTTIILDGGEAYLEWRNFPEGKLKYGIKDGILAVEELSGEWALSNTAKNRSLVIHLPASTDLKEVKVEVGVGDVTLQDFSMEELTVKGGVGETNLQNLAMGSLWIEGGVGSLHSEGLNCSGSVHADGGVGDLELSGDFRGDVELSARTGDVSLDGTLEGNLQAESGIGDVDIHLLGDPKVFWYDVQGGAGEISVNGEISFGKDYQTSNDGASHKISVTGGVGDVTIDIH